MYKFSKYNFLIEVDKESFLLYNSLSNGLLKFENPAIIQKLKQWNKYSNISESEFELMDRPIKNELLEGNFILIDTINELSYFIQRRNRFHKAKLTNDVSFDLTIAPTNRCNMGCAYCYQGTKPKIGELSSQSIQNIIKVLKKEVIKPRFSSRIKKVHVSWFGGEPLMVPDIINNASKKIIDFCNAREISYSSSIITNGVLLTPENWNLLKANSIKHVQVTIDGNEETHNSSRPLFDGKKSYWIILENLKNKPDNISITIRINCNAKTIQSIDGLLEDLYAYKIWPHMAKQIKIQLAYIYSAFQNSSSYLTEKDFYSFKRKFTYKKLVLYNKWADEQGIRRAKQRLEYPRVSFLYCRTLHNPYGMVINQDGNISKCWHYTNSDLHQLQNVSDNFADIKDNNQFINFINLSPINIDEGCKRCKVMPICGYSCPDTFIDKTAKKLCCHWKYDLKEVFKEQYLFKKEHPDLIQNYEEIVQNSRTFN